MRCESWRSFFFWSHSGHIEVGREQGDSRYMGFGGFTFNHLLPVPLHDSMNMLTSDMGLALSSSSLFNRRWQFWYSVGITSPTLNGSGVSPKMWYFHGNINALTRLSCWQSWLMYLYRTTTYPVAVQTSGTLYERGLFGERPPHLGSLPWIWRRKIGGLIGQHMIHRMPLNRRTMHPSARL